MGICRKVKSEMSQIGREIEGEEPAGKATPGPPP